MRFYRNKGKPAKYLVSVYGWNIEDKYYYSAYKDAKEFFNTIKDKETKAGNAVSVYDMKNDIRKDFARGGR